MHSSIPAKYSTLPRISGSKFDQEPQTDLVPFLSHHEPDSDMDERIRTLETRLMVTEKSNRALLDEVVRLQNEFKSVSRKNDEVLREERQARKYLETSLRSHQDVMSQLSVRLKSTEDVLAEEKGQLVDLLGQARSMEQEVKSSSHDTQLQRDRYMGKIAAMENEIESMSRDRQKLERISFQLVEEMRGLKTKLESQGYDFSSATSDLRNKARKLEEDYHFNLETIRKQFERQSDTGQVVQQQSRGIIDQRTGELRDVLVQLRNRQEEEVAERRNLEQTMQVRLSEVSRAVAEQIRQREEAVHNLIALQKEREHKAENDKLALQNKMAEMAEAINSRVLEKELRLREEQTRRQAELEKILRTEQDSRLSYERDLRGDNEKRWEAVKRLQSDELVSLKEQQKHDRDKYIESVRRLDEAVSLLEKQMDEDRREVSKVLSAEIKTRAQKDKDYRSRLEELEEKISAATTSLQHAIGGVASSYNTSGESARKIAAETMDDYKRELMRQIGDLDARILSIQNRFTTFDHHVDDKIAAASVSMMANMREKVESISLWQGSTNTALAELRSSRQTLDDEVHRMKETVSLMKSETHSRVASEIDARIQDVETVRRELAIFKENVPKETMASKAEVDQCQASIRKLAESMQTVKTVLGMKIQSEQKLRVEEVKSLQDEVIQIRTLIEPLVHQKMDPKLFVKPPEGEREGKTREVMEATAVQINRWSMYNVYRWMTWKSRWVYAKWARSNRKGQGNKPPARSQLQSPTLDPENPRWLPADHDQRALSQ